MKCEYKRSNGANCVKGPTDDFTFLYGNDNANHNLEFTYGDDAIRMRFLGVFFFFFFFFFLWSRN